MSSSSNSCQGSGSAIEESGRLWVKNGWVTLKKQDLLDITGLTHIWKHRLYQTQV